MKIIAKAKKMQNCCKAILILSFLAFNRIKFATGDWGIYGDILSKKYINDHHGFFTLYVDKKENPLDESQEAPQRKSRDTMDTSKEGLECLSCYADGISFADENCYKGSGISTRKCLDAEKCYIELHPLYIKRGCVLPGSLNRTFVCKCPLCNDKPSYDSAYYEYTKLSDWEYDNERLKKPLTLENLMCKVCETKGVNKISDNSCKSGLSIESKICDRGHVCFTNIDESTDYVSRGCIKKPGFNRFYKFCDDIICNNMPMPYPKREYSLTPMKVIIASTSVNMSPSINTFHVKFVCFILFLLLDLDI